MTSIRRAFLDLHPANTARGVVRVPGSKSISIRALLLAALSDGETTIDGLLASDDTTVMRDALQALGVPVRVADTLLIDPADLRDEGPVRSLRVDASASSQFLTGLLQAAPLLARDADLTIDVEGDLISRPYVDLTVALMARFGVAVREEPAHRFHVARGARYVSPGTIDVEGDASSASYLLAAGLLGGGPVRVRGIPRDSLQGDARFVDVLIAMGAQIGWTDDAIEVASPGVASGFRLRAIDADFNDIPDAAMTVAVLALFAAAPCTLRNIGSWRVKETDRLAAMATELERFGAQVEVGDDWLRVHPLSPAALARLTEHAVRGEPIAVETYDDHRMAMCFSLTRFLGVPVRILDPDCVAKTFPDYFERFEALVEHSGPYATLAHAHA